MLIIIGSLLLISAVTAAAVSRTAAVLKDIDSEPGPYAWHTAPTPLETVEAQADADWCDALTNTASDLPTNPNDWAPTPTPVSVRYRRPPSVAPQPAAVPWHGIWDQQPVTPDVVCYTMAPEPVTTAVSQEIIAFIRHRREVALADLLARFAAIDPEQIMDRLLCSVGLRFDFAADTVTVA